MEIIFKEKEIGDILIEYVKSHFTLGDKTIEVSERYNEYKVTVSDPETEQSESEE